MDPEIIVNTLALDAENGAEKILLFWKNLAQLHTKKVAIEFL